MKNNDLLDRTFYFGISCLKFLRTLPNDNEYRLIRYQLGKSSTSLGANYEESLELKNIFGAIVNNTKL